MSGKPYTYTGSGTNSQGNHYCSRQDSSMGSHGYHYSNTDGSYYYKNTNGSTYFKDGAGNARYTPANGGSPSSSVSGQK